MVLSQKDKYTLRAAFAAAHTKSKDGDKKVGVGRNRRLAAGARSLDRTETAGPKRRCQAC
jgi:hypothetical protein